jgi:tRNA threonylcarbamoyladenosine biosynthesis protein TsaE
VLVCRSRSVAETEALGERLGRAAFPGAVLLLEGPLGAGKTALARGIARGLETGDTVTSPSFGLLAVHDGALTLFHLDLYRISEPSELRSLDLAEIFASGGVAVVEWPRWLVERPPAGTLEVEIEIEGPHERRLAFRPRDARWEPALGAAIAGV